MSYATQQDLVDRFGATELVQLTDRTNRPATAIDAAVVERAIGDATALADGYLGKAYTLPLAVVPPVLTKTICDIARYYLHGKSAEKDGAIERAYLEARRWLGDVSRGSIMIEAGGVAPAQPAGGIADISAGAPLRSGERAMTDGIRLTVDDRAITAALDRLEHADRATAMHAIGAYLLTSTQRRFERQVGPDGKPWERLRPRTAAQRIGRRRRGHLNILRVTNRLYSSLSYQANADEVAVGTNLVQAAIHQLGGTIDMPERQQTVFQIYNAKTGDIKGFVPRRRANLARDVQVKAHQVTIPARPYLGVDEADRTEVLRIIGDHYRAAVGGGAA